MQYLIEVQGNVKNNLKKAYVVEANDEKNAEKTAINNFANEYDTDGIIMNVQSSKRTFKAILVFVFMAIPIFLSFIHWKNGHETVSIRPDYISCLYGVILYSSFVIRFKGVRRTVSSWIDILFCVFNVLLLSSFIRTILVSKTINILGIMQFDIDANILLPIAIVLSWLGLKLVSLSCIAGVTLIALFNITSLNLAMGHIFGPIYIISSFIGILLYLSVEPAFVESFNKFKKFVKTSHDNLNSDITSAKTEVESIKNAIHNSEKNKSKKIGENK